MKSIDMPQSMIKRMEALREDARKVEKELEEEYKIEEYIERRKRIDTNFSNTISLLVEGFLADKEIPENTQVRLDKGKIHFEKVEEKPQEAIEEATLVENGTDAKLSQAG